MNLRTIVVDDSVIFRKVVRDCLGELPGVDVVDFARDGTTAVDKIRFHRPDLVTLDLELPGLDGLEVLSALQREQIDTNVVIISSSTLRGAATTAKALQFGAFDFILKPEGHDRGENMDKVHRQLALAVDALRRRQSSSSRGSEPDVSVPVGSPPPDESKRPQQGLDAICIGVSTGGPKALTEVLPKLSSSVDVPILVVQHMPPLFTATLANELNQEATLDVVEASHNMPLRGGTVYLAPGGKQMRIGGRPGNWAIEVRDDAAVKNCKPSVDYLFRSAADKFRNRMLAIVMTGMGDDGLVGCQAVERSGGRIWAQNEASSTVYGMPRRVVEAGLADRVVSLTDIRTGIERQGRRQAALTASQEI